MKHSIARQIAGIFIGLMVLVLALNLAVNGFFLERYYIVRLERTLRQSYQLLDDHIAEDEIDTEYFRSEFSAITTSTNMSLVVVDRNYQIILSTREGTNQIMAARLWGYNTDTDTEDAQILKKTASYTIQKKMDGKLNTGFLEMWGELTSGYYFMMRIPLENISENARISNEFILYFSLIAILLSILVIMWVSRRIARPLKELTTLSKRMAGLDFDAKYTSGGSNEIGQLGDNFNQMSAKLEETISQLKSANNELQRDIERKIQIDDMRKEFLSNVSHELKTPLALIQGYSEGLKECVNDDEESREFYCDVIIDEASKMNNMVRKLLTLNQLEFGNEQAEMERFDIAQLISGKIQSTQILAQQKGACITYEGEDRLSVWGDEFRVEEVLTNYLSNALNHVDGQMQIRINAARVQGKVRVSVFNTGKQIPEEDLDKIWVKFYKVDKAHTREYGGSGVGLSIVKAIMDSMHQKFGVENKPDGVCFWFELDSAEGGANTGVTVPGGSDADFAQQESAENAPDAGADAAMRDDKRTLE